MVIKAIFDFARSEPNRPAIVAGGTTRTYADVARGILGAEAIIKSYGLAPGQRIGVAIRELSKAWMFILAAEKLEILATSLPSSSTASQIGVKGVGLWIADRHVQQSWTTPTHWVETDEWPGQNGNFDLTQEVADPTHKFRLIIFSSGTTGIYKPIAVRGPARDARIALAVAEGRESPDFRHFIGDFGPWTAHGSNQVFRVLTVGSKMVFEQELEPWKAILAHQPTNFFMTPGTARRFFKTLPGDFPRQDRMCVTVSGGALTPALLQILQSRLTRDVVQSYASTESGLIARTPIARPEDLLEHRLLKGSEIQAVDDNHNPLPFGVEGVLRVRRQDMSEGYFEDPESTAAHFRDGWFYPGDVGVVLDEAKFRLTGRSSEVININGNKVAPSVIEDGLRAMWTCDDVAALSEPVTGGRDVLHIFVSRPRNMDDAKIKGPLKPLTPAFSKIRVHRVDAIPRTTTGKVQYRLLREQLQKQ